MSRSVPAGALSLGGGEGSEGERERQGRKIVRLYMFPIFTGGNNRFTQCTVKQEFLVVLKLALRLETRSNLAMFNFEMRLLKSAFFNAGILRTAAKYALNRLHAKLIARMRYRIAELILCTL